MKTISVVGAALGLTILATTSASAQQRCTGWTATLSSDASEFCECATVTTGFIRAVQRKPDFEAILASTSQTCPKLATLLSEVQTAAFDSSTPPDGRGSPGSSPESDGDPDDEGDEGQTGDEEDEGQAGDEEDEGETGDEEVAEKDPDRGKDWGRHKGKKHGKHRSHKKDKSRGKKSASFGNPGNHKNVGRAGERPNGQSGWGAGDRGRSDGFGGKGPSKSKGKKGGKRF